MFKRAEIGWSVSSNLQRLHIFTSLINPSNSKQFWKAVKYLKLGFYLYRWEPNGKGKILP